MDGFLIYLAIIAVCGISAGKIAEKRNLPQRWFLVAGFAFGIFGVLAAWAWPDPVKAGYRRAAANAEAAAAAREKAARAARLSQAARDKQAGRW